MLPACPALSSESSRSPPHALSSISAMSSSLLCHLPCHAVRLCAFVHHELHRSLLSDFITGFVTFCITRFVNCFRINTSIAHVLASNVLFAIVVVPDSSQSILDRGAAESERMRLQSSVLTQRVSTTSFLPVSRLSQLKAKSFRKSVKPTTRNAIKSSRPIFFSKIRLKPS